ncbi:hypothetical protein OH77DRAFT_1525010 [Trametes cingulata]|nr:hypothetical protein OH77DRAFT_1525605 [Trametes cingulata]KAI0350315.1 hypothetical protein OH77DRAFT_1525010 [Trametes cingulata]
MAFILADKNTLARDLWPGEVGKIAQERELTSGNLRGVRLVPTELEELADWLWIDNDTGMSQLPVFVRSDVDGFEEVCHAGDTLELVVRLQGRIGQMNLTIGGDWDGTEVHAKKATQWLTLVDGGCKEAFGVQVKAIEAVREVVQLHLGRCVDRGRNRTGAIDMRRRVFTKVNPGNDDVPSVIKKVEDPRGKFEAIRHAWRVTDRIVVAKQMASGKILPMPSLALRRGDFVDVSARVAVTVLRGPTGRRYEVYFEPTTIIRLATGTEFDDISRTAGLSMNANTARRGGGKPKVLTNSFTIEGSAAGGQKDGDGREQMVVEG